MLMSGVQHFLCQCVVCYLAWKHLKTSHSFECVRQNYFIITATINQYARIHFKFCRNNMIITNVLESVCFIMKPSYIIKLTYACVFWRGLRTDRIFKIDFYRNLFNIWRNSYRIVDRKSFISYFRFSYHTKIGCILSKIWLPNFLYFMYFLSSSILAPFMPHSL